MLFSLFINAIAIFVGAVYPMIETFKAHEARDITKQARWIRYWIMFGAYLMVDWVADVLFLQYIVPGFSVLKILFLVWAVNPWTSGSEIMYTQVISPQIKKYYRSVDQFISTAASHTGNLLRRNGLKLLSHMHHNVIYYILNGTEQRNIGNARLNISFEAADRLSEFHERGICFEEQSADDVVDNSHLADYMPEHIPDLLADRSDSVLVRNSVNHTTSHVVASESEGDRKDSDLADPTYVPPKRTRTRKPRNVIDQGSTRIGRTRKATASRSMSRRQLQRMSNDD
ncbi:hypothetical protein AB6A40_005166 [Gnathostoma spinigerum]|uniref:Receptor expression-enhancing protein n=1 Tax=Gnathostoma spinigerum TaxID=75299 RepID=A0ABD6EPH7_9BILA